MRYVQIPADVSIRIKNPQSMTGPPGADTILNRTFLETFEDVWLNHPTVFGESATAIRISAKLQSLFIHRKPGDWVAVEDADFQKLKQAVETSSYNPVVARQLLPFIVAVTDAKDEKPDELKA